MEIRNPAGINYDPAGAIGAKFSVKSGYANRPVSFVSWYDCIRFVNWLQNGQGNGDTESGTYLINGGGKNSGTVIVPDAATREAWNTSNPHWVLPSEDEWYKAAYHKNDGATANYWNYPTRSDVAPANLISDPDSGNNANYDYATGGQLIPPIPPPTTVVGEFENSYSSYWTFDQGGNVWELNETWIGSEVCVRGGGWNPSGSFLNASTRTSTSAAYNGESGTTGFRVAFVPEPESITLVLVGTISVLVNVWRWRRKTV